MDEKNLEVQICTSPEADLEEYFKNYKKKFFCRNCGKIFDEEGKLFYLNPLVADGYADRLYNFIAECDTCKKRKERKRKILASRGVYHLGEVNLTRKKLEEIKKKYNVSRKFVHTKTYSGLILVKYHNGIARYIIGMYNIAGAGGGLVFKDKNLFLEVLQTFFEEECKNGSIDLSLI